MSGILDGIRVVELSEGWSGAAICGRMLADLGAEVIKIEPPEGDPLRHRPPFHQGNSIPFAFVSAGKRSHVLDLRADAGAVARVLEVARHADVLLEGPHAGFSVPETASAECDGLIHCAVSTFGRTGVLAEVPGSDLIAQATSGLMASTGYADAPPTRVGVSVAEHAAAIFATTGIAAALIHRRSSRRGQFIDISAQDCLFCFHSSYLPKVFLEGNAPPRMGFRHPMISPWDSYRTKDGHVIVCTGTDAHWRDIRRVVGAEDVPEDDYLTPELRVRNADGVQQIIESWTLRHTVEEVVSAFEAIGVPSGPALDLEAVLAHPHFRARQMLVEIGMGRQAIPVSGSIFKMSRTPGVPAAGAPSLGDASPAESGFSVSRVRRSI